MEGQRFASSDWWKNLCPTRKVHRQTRASGVDIKHRGKWIFLLCFSRVTELQVSENPRLWSMDEMGVIRDLEMWKQEHQPLLGGLTAWLRHCIFFAFFHAVKTKGMFFSRHIPHTHITSGICIGTAVVDVKLGRTGNSCVPCLFSCHG